MTTATFCGDNFIIFHYFFLPPLSDHLMPGVMFLFNVCTFTGPLIVYKELSVAAWNYTCHNLEIACN